MVAEDCAGALAHRHNRAAQAAKGRFRQTGHAARANAASHALGYALALVTMPALAQQVDAVRHPQRAWASTSSSPAWRMTD